MTETEIKIRLENQADYQKLAHFLGQPQSIENQVNYYLDDNQGYFTKSKSTFRLRSVRNGDPRAHGSPDCAFVTYKSKNRLADGISTSQELEEPIDIKLLSVPFQQIYDNSPLFKKILDELNISPQNIQLLGSIRTTRSVYLLEKFKLELDSTDYGFDHNYEIEIETPNPQAVKLELETLLKQLNIHFADSKANKFTNFVNGKIIK